MHEFSVTKGIVNLLLDEIENKKIDKVLVVNLVIGDLSTIIDDSVQLYFDLLTENTKLYGAKLVFKRVRAKFKCRDCELVFEKIKSGFECPNCGKLGYPTGEGKEFYVESIEV